MELWEGTACGSSAPRQILQKCFWWPRPLLLTTYLVPRQPATARVVITWGDRPMDLDIWVVFKKVPSIPPWRVTDSLCVGGEIIEGGGVNKGCRRQFTQTADDLTLVGACLMPDTCLSKCMHVAEKWTPTYTSTQGLTCLRCCCVQFTWKSHVKMSGAFDAPYVRTIPCDLTLQRHSIIARAELAILCTWLCTGSRAAACVRRNVSLQRCSSRQKTARDVALRWSSSSTCRRASTIFTFR
jgi:hypothetical protein